MATPCFAIHRTGQTLLTRLPVAVYVPVSTRFGTFLRFTVRPTHSCHTSHVRRHGKAVASRSNSRGAPAGQGGGRTNKGSHRVRASQSQHVNAGVQVKGVSKPSNTKQRARVWEVTASKPQQKNERKSKSSARRGVSMPLSSYGSGHAAREGRHNPHSPTPHPSPKKAPKPAKPPRPNINTPPTTANQTRRTKGRHVMVEGSPPPPT